MAALLTIEAANTDKLAMYLGECRDLGVPILAPDINSSELAFTVEGRRVRFGLCAVKNVGEGAILSMLAVRKELGGSTRSTRCASTSTCGWSTSGCSRAWSRPARSTRCGGVGGERRVAPRAAVRRGRQGASSTAAGISATATRGSRSCSAASATSRRRGCRAAGRAAVDRSAAARRREGSARPLHERPPARALRRGAEDLRRARVAELVASEADVWVGGIVSALRPLKTKKGDRMAVFMLDDVAGNVEVVVFPETFGKHGSLIEADAMLLVRGKFEKDDESARIVATELLPIAALKERTTREVVIHLSVRDARAPDVRGARRAAVAASRRPPRLPRAARREGAAGRAARAGGRRAAGPAVGDAGDRSRTAVRRRFGRAAVGRNRELRMVRQ